MSLLFQAMQLGSLQLDNRIIIAPMCQYSATAQGEVSYWHQQQWAKYALSGAGLCLIEATAVHAEGRISYADLGLWNDHQAHKMQQLLAELKSISPMPMGVQLAHAGRKASVRRPWEGGGQLPPDNPQGWLTVSATDLPFHTTDVPPHALTVAEIHTIIQDFVAAAIRAVDAGFDIIEIHAAHGYLLHQFMSPLTNQRTDGYGGGFAERIRFTLEVFQAIKQALPAHYPVGVRISATDWVAEQPSWDLDSSILLAQQLEQLGAAYIHVSSGGLDAQQKIEVQPGYQVPFAHAIKQYVQIPVIAVGLITDPIQAEEILQQQQADAIAIARAILYDPNWPWHAAAALDEKIAIAPQYLRCQPHGLKDLFHSF
ncbi:MULTISPECIES: NADH:flavin oxidoreductase/NADH oxidase [unclassified Acinetobacter]|uniref:NADH:flavin oxidoreductase/NADH oxidase n=1 Tax=unclassified Acinetobacter TaxID=196816 RepID=UPI0029349F9F|nr:MULTISPECIES: NADH:flavin oxidoreductase/NADH oxidase [unclassified Acinetobacter]WOE33028.1 NADH:flavin oxidoreductase/NADH oxidase [Acinetobacter sp. SAAs470]WOE38506.1 NADH:flavin oxidoreductase/NADH oxidase [Acinetobacter sp. SAAs474]